MFNRLRGLESILHQAVHRLPLGSARCLCSVTLGVLLGVALGGCETTELNTLSATTLPIRTGPVLVVYELGALDRRRVPPADDPAKTNPVTIFEFLSNSVGRRIPAALQAKGYAPAFIMRSLGPDTIPSSVVAEIPEAPVDTSGFTHELRIRAAKDTVTCRDERLCSHQLTVRASIVRSGSNAVLWSTEIREPAVTSLVIDARRLDTLADQLAQAALLVIRRAN